MIGDLGNYDAWKLRSPEDDEYGFLRREEEADEEEIEEFPVELEDLVFLMPLDLEIGP